MTGDPSYAMQAAIASALNSSSALATAMGGTARIFDSVSQGAVYPYVRIGEDQTIGASHGCGDSYEFIATAHIFARQIESLGARPLAKRIGGAVVGALTSDDLEPSGFIVSDFELVSTRYYFEDDGLTAHGVVSVRYLVDPAS